MKYTELKVYASRQGIEQLTVIFLEHGIDQLSIDDPEDMEDILNKKNEYGWDYIEDDLKANLDREPTVSCYFTEDDDQSIIDQLEAEIKKLRDAATNGLYGSIDLGSLTTERNVTDDSDWKDKWKEFFKPTRITDQLVVKPTWEQYEPEDGDLVIEIDPGMAFGTGTHETTSLCMKLMAKYLKQLDGKKVMDVGCGSGILSIAAALLGADDVLGVEIDEDSVRVARENVELNNASSHVKVIQGDLTKGINYSANVLVANLMADLVINLSRSAGVHLEDGGVFISSGILVEKEEMVSEAIKNAGFVIDQIVEDGEWCAIAAVKK